MDDTHVKIDLEKEDDCPNYKTAVRWNQYGCGYSGSRLLLQLEINIASSDGTRSDSVVHDVVAPAR